jgi:hypothetical protein
MTLTSNMTHAHSRRLVRATILPVALAGTMLTAPAAYALTEQQIADECKTAGGTYTTSIAPDGSQDSACCYKDIKGNKYCDYYLNGKYLGTGPGRVNPPPTGPTEQPVQPPPGTVAPVNPGTPQGPQQEQPPATVAPVIP